MQTTMPSPHPSWETALDRYFATRAKHDLTTDYRVEERRLLTQMREAWGQTRSPFDLQEDQLLQFFLDLKERQGLSAPSRAHYAIALRGFLKYTGAPALRWVPRFPKSAPKDEGRYITGDERAAMWAACLDPEEELILALGFGMGWRQSDVLGARLGDFAPSAEFAQTVTMHGKGEKFQTVELALHPKVQQVLPRYVAWRAARIVSASALNKVPPAEPGSLLIAVSKHLGLGAMAEETFRQRLRGIYARAGVDPAGWPSHNLRRTWAENRLNAVTKEFCERGENPAMALELALRTVQREGRWKSAETLRLYLQRRMVASTTSLAKTLV